MKVPDEEMKKKLDKFLRDWVLAEERGLTRKENVHVSQHGKKYNLRYALYTKGRYLWNFGRKTHIPSKLYGGITVEKYEEYRDYIEAKMHEIEIAERWITHVLKGENLLVDEGHGLYALKMRVPSDVWAKIKRHFFYVNRDWYEDMDEFTTGYWDRYYGWATREPDKVMEILRGEAEKRATDEHRKVAGLEKGKDKEMERAIEVAKKEASAENRDREVEVGL